MKKPLRRLSSFLPALAMAILWYFANAYAAYATMETVICGVYYMVVGPIGEGVASAGVLAIGVSAVMGKASWGLALTVAIGISITFGAVTLAGVLGVASPC